MTRVNRLGLIAAIAIGTALAPAFAADVTVGRFYTELAKAKQLASANAASAEASLRGAGFKLPELALNKPLTEGDVTSISKAIGVTVTTSRSASPISESQLNAFMASFGHQIGAPTVGGGQNQTFGDGTGGIDPGNSGNGKGKKKGHNKSTSEPL
jgi:hypothetical protein